WLVHAGSARRDAAPSSARRSLALDPWFWLGSNGETAESMQSLAEIGKSPSAPDGLALVVVMCSIFWSTKIYLQCPGM
uniref:Uncharacterized protein n=1 Tax=Triticum urartu TaxID=4572 RepID=A0A8R7QVJ2_TRIUA